jgi:hypothetical protein
MRVTLEILKTLPKYIQVGEGGCAMRLKGYLVYESKYTKEFEVEYWRDGGLWGYKTFKIDKHGRIFGFWRGWGLKHLMGKEFFPTTYDFWKEDNGRYVSSETKAFDLDEYLKQPYVCCNDEIKNGWSHFCKTCGEPLVW